MKPDHIVRELLQNFPGIRRWVFDNDGTLYDPSGFKGIEKAVEAKMDEWFAYQFGLPDVVQGRNERLAMQTINHTKMSVIALNRAGHTDAVIVDFVANTYLSVDPKDYGIVPNARLTYILSNLPGEKFVLTNNPTLYATMILKAMGIAHLFTGILGTDTIAYRQKPDHVLFTLMGETWGKEVVFFDDNPENLIVAHHICGWNPVLVGKKPHPRFTARLNVLSKG